MLPDKALARRAIVVDDHPIMAEAVVDVIGPLFEHVEAVESLADAFRLLESQPDCQLAVLDLHLKESEGRDTVTAMRERFPEMPLFVYTADGSLANITMAFECGVRGFASKTAPREVVAAAIRLVLSGGVYIPPEATSMLGVAPPRPSGAAKAPAPSLRLSVRQEQVFRLLLQGMPNKVIGARLDMAEGTVKTHLNSVYRMLGVRTRVEAILRALQLGIL